MGNKDTYAKGLLVHQWVGSIEFDKLDADFLVVRVGETPAALEATSAFVDEKYAEFVQKAYEKGIPVIAWYDLKVKKYGDTSWPVNDFSRWGDRQQDMTMTVLDRMLSNRHYWHGLIMGVDVGDWQMYDKTYDVSPLWMSRTIVRVRDLVKAAYPGKQVWPEVRSGIIDNAEWDTQGLLQLDTQKWVMSAWDNKGAQTVKGVLELDKLIYPEEHMPMYLMPTRSGSFWRCITVNWDGVKNLTGGAISLPVYLYYGSKESLYKAIGFTAPTSTPEPPTEEPTDPTQPVPTVPTDAEAKEYLRRIAVAVEKLAGVLK